MRDDIPFDWTANQSLAPVDFLEDLAEQIWSRYGLAIRGCSLVPGLPGDTLQLTLPFPPLWEYRIGGEGKRLDDDIPW